jgi:glycosyltransferase involved in cell wall biosynthesis
MERSTSPLLKETGLRSDNKTKRRARVLISAYSCLVNAGHPFPGGGDLMAWNVIRRLGRACDIWVITCDENRSAIEERLRKEPVPGVEFHFVGLPRWMNPLLGSMGSLHIYAYLWQWAAYFAARRLHRQIRFDLAHHLTYTNDWMASVIGALLPVPYIRGPGGGAHRVPRPFLRQFSFRARFAEHCRSFGQWVFRHDPFFLLGQSRAKIIFACNHEAEQGVARRWRHKVRLLSVNGISADELAPPYPYVRGEKFRVLSAGRLIPLKGFDLALRAFKVFAEKCPSAEFTIVGDGPELTVLQKLIRDLGLEGRVYIEKWMPRGQLLAAMRDCAVFVFLSLRDGGGLVVIEAMAGGRPVVCLGLGGPGLHVVEGSGIKIPAHSPEQVIAETAVALELLVKDNDLCERLGRGARQRAAEVYDWDHLAERLLKIYEEVLAGPCQEA